VNAGGAAVVETRRAYGATRLLTWVIAGNRGARTFYERPGGERLAGQPSARDGMNLVEAGCGGRDLDALATAPASNAPRHPHTLQTYDGRAA
jgi:hypothetical protein